MLGFSEGCSRDCAVVSASIRCYAAQCSATLLASLFIVEAVPELVYRFAAMARVAMLQDC